MDYHVLARDCKPIDNYWMLMSTNVDEYQSKLGKQNKKQKIIVMKSEKKEKETDEGCREGGATVQESWFQLYSPLSHHSIDYFVFEQVPIASVNS